MEELTEPISSSEETTKVMDMVSPCPRESTMSMVKNFRIHQRIELVATPIALSVAEASQRFCAVYAPLVTVVQSDKFQPAKWDF
jgi:hypothetical protein